MKKIVRLTENDIRNLVKETVNTMMNNGYDDDEIPAMIKPAPGTQNDDELPAFLKQRGYGDDEIPATLKSRGNVNENKKKVVRINESELKNMIMESVKRVLSEGKVTNNAPYFAKKTRWVPGGYHDKGGGYIEVVGDKDFDMPGSKFAKDDDIKRADSSVYDKIYDISNQLGGGNGYIGDDIDDDSRFTQAAELGSLRQKRQNDYAQKDDEKGQLHNLRLNAMKCGIPKDIILKFKPQTLYKMIHDLEGRPNYTTRTW